MPHRRADPQGGELKEVVEPAAKREAVWQVAETCAVNLRRACGWMRISRSSCEHQTEVPGEGALRAALEMAAAKRRRCGYWMLTESSRRDRFTDNHKWIDRASPGSACALSAQQEGPESNLKPNPAKTG